MHLNSWKSVLVSWANALEVTPTTLNFIGDLSPHFFVNLCSYINGNDNTLEDAVNYITDYYKSLILGNEDDENYFVLLATAYLILTSVHNTNNELCKRLCRVSDREQAQIIKTALEAFVEIQPSKITKELLFATLAQLPGDPESCGNSPYLNSSGSRSSNNGTPGSDGETTRRRSSRFKRVKHQLQMTMNLKSCLQDELDSARETISNLESVVRAKNQDIVQLKERCQRLLNESDADRSKTPSSYPSPVCGRRECIRCKALERQVASYQEVELQDKSRIEELTEALATLNIKIVKLELEHRLVDDQMRLYEEQILKNNNEISTLQQHHKNLLANKNELESIIEELKETRSAEDCSLEGDIPSNLGNEVIDLQLTELRFSLDDKVQTIHEQDEEISSLRVKLKQKDVEMEKTVALKDEKIYMLEQEAARLAESLCQMEIANVNLNDECKSLKTILAEKCAGISDLQNEILQHESVIQSIQQENELCNKKILSLNLDVEKLASCFDQATHQLFEVKNQKAGIENLLEECQLQLANVSEELDKQREDIKNKEALCKDHEKVLIIKDEKIASLEDEVERINQVITQEQEKTGIHLKELEKNQLKILMLETAVDNYSGKIENCELVKRELNQEIVNCRERVNVLEGYVLQLTNTNQQSVSELQVVVEQKKCVEVLLGETEEKVQNLNYMVSDLRNQLKQESAKFVTALRDSQTALKEKEQIISTYQKSLEEKNIKLLQESKSRLHLEETVSFKEKLISSLEEDIKDIKETLRKELDAKTNLEQECKTLQSTLVENNNEISILKDERQKNQSVIQEKVLEIELSNSRVLNLQNDVEKLTGEYKLATSQLTDAQKAKVETEQQLHESFQRISSLSEEMGVYKEEFQKLEKVLAEKNENVTSLEEEVVRITAVAQLKEAKSKNLVAELETQKHEFEKRLFEIEETIALKERLISSLEEDIMGIKETLRKELDAKTNLEQECKALQSTVVENNNEISILKDERQKNQSVIQEKVLEIELSNSRVLNLQNDVEKLTGEYKLATSQLTDAQKAKVETEQQLHESFQRISSLSEEMGVCKEEFQKLEKVLAEKNENLTSLEEEVVRITAVAQLEEAKSKNLVAELETQKHEFEKRLFEIEETIALKERLISSLEEDIKGIKETLRNELDAKTILEQECKALQSTVVENNNEISILKDEHQKNQSVIQEKVLEIELSNSRVLNLQNDVEKLTGEYKLATSQLTDARKAKVETEQQLHESFQRISSLSEEMGVCKEEFQKLEKVLAEKNENVTSLEEEVVRITAVAQLEEAKSKNLVAELQTQKHEFEKRLFEIEETIALKERLISSLEEDIKGIKETLRKELDARTNLEQECKALQSTVVENNNEISILKDEHQKNQSVIQEKVLEIELSNSRVLNLQNDVEKLTGEYKLATSQLTDAQKAKVETEQQLHESFQRISSLSEEMGVCKEEFQKLEKVLAEKNENVTSLEEEVVRITAVAQLEEAKSKNLVAELETQKHEFEKRLFEIEETIALKERLISLLEEDIEGIKETLRNELDAKTNLEQECKALQSTVVENNNEISILKDERQKNQSVIQEKVLEIELSNSRVLNLQNDVEKLTGEYKLATSQLTDAQKAKVETEQQLHESFQRISSLSEEMSVRKEEFQRLELQCRGLEEALGEKSEKLASLENGVAHTKLVMREIEAENHKCKEMMAVLQAQVVQLTQSNEVTDAKLLKILELKNFAEERVTALEDHLKQKVRDEEKLQQDLLALNIALVKEQELLRKSEEEKKYLECLKGEAEIDKASSDAVVHSLQHEVERLTKENESCAARLKCENESLNRRIENCSMDLDIKHETILMMQTTLSFLNSKIAHLEAEIKVKDSDLLDARAALDRYREEHQSKLLSRIEEMMTAIHQKDAELAKLHNENDSKSERIEKMAEELLHVSQTFNIEKASLVDHTNNLEEMLEKSASAEKALQTKIMSLTKELELKDGKLSQLDEKLSLTVELHNCEKRELTSKNNFLKTQMDETKLKYDRLVRDMEECNVEHLRSKISTLETESQDLRDKLELKVKDIQWYTHELDVLQKSASQTMNINAKLEEEIQSLTRSKAREIAQLEKEIAVLLEKTKNVQPHASDISAKLRQEYEEKLDKLKARMRKVYTEKVEAMMKYKTGEENMLMEEELKKEKQKRLALESKVRELSDQLLIVQEERRALISNNIFRAPAYPLGGPISNPAYESPPLYKAQSLDRLPVTSHGLDNLGADFLDQSCSRHMDQSFSSRRTSTSSNRSSHLPKGIGKVFPAAEEDGEVFDNRCLADLKEGICTLPSGPGGVDRMSILQQRNSMCPPHLKSSYPVESQFFAPNAKEDEIKVISRGNKENQPEGHHSVPVTPSKLRSFFTGRRKH